MTMLSTKDKIFHSALELFASQGIQASVDLKAEILFPIHWSKFDLSIHPWD